jgi:hypothetical protein
MRIVRIYKLLFYDHEIKVDFHIHFGVSSRLFHIKVKVERWLARTYKRKFGISLSFPEVADKGLSLNWVLEDFWLFDF